MRQWSECTEYSKMKWHYLKDATTDWECRLMYKMNQEVPDKMNNILMDHTTDWRYQTR